MQGTGVKITEHMDLTGIHDPLRILWEHRKTNTSNGRSPLPRDLGRSLGEITGSNTAGVMDVCLLWMLCLLR